ncbi:LSU ribosomal protein L30P [Acetomicrobium thermoterrenum DSM 13490]|jgi:large subunit ribosomal protein L30|uniref:50S ribosomal protein L30 n=2 Tax=Acetomicrobium TaxID=49894 RepID=A0A0T5XDN7_9BACT|nr:MULTISPECIES: 50S ribosomal protein L30 [Acetomicrobium]KRT35829.1 ribosomal protein L30 [Acetomicrobium hydrogeniformans ATCC BAA-1850]SDX65146.1 LSU ribosomal protein L30P [Acetomicrobium thermoterrenum DSM 13490]
MSKIRVTWKKSTIGRPERQRKSIRALGLKKLNHSVTHDDTPQIRGMIRAVEHLIDWEIVE